MTFHFSDENIGTMAVIGAVLGAAILPVLSYTIKGVMTPVLFTFVLTLPALLVNIVYYLTTKKSISIIFLKENRVWLSLVALLGAVIPVILLAILPELGVPGTTISILLLTEIIFSLIAGNVLLNEHVGVKQILAALTVIAGATLAITSGTIKLSSYWPLAILVPFCWQCAHLTYRIKLPHISPSDVLLGRLFYGSAFLFVTTLVFESFTPLFKILTIHNTLQITSSGIFCLFIGNFLWYIALSKINLSKATTIVMTYPAVTFVFFSLLGSQTTALQWIGVIVATTGAVGAGMMPSKKIDK